MQTDLWFLGFFRGHQSFEGEEVWEDEEEPCRYDQSTAAAAATASTTTGELLGQCFSELEAQDTDNYCNNPISVN